MSWFKREPGSKTATEESERTVRTEGLWLKCDGCREIIWKKDLELSLRVCGKCGHHFRLDARARLAMLFDNGEYQEHDRTLSSSDPLQFVDQKPYSERLKATQAATSMSDALIAAEGTLAGRRVHICAMESKFIGGSMGAVVGEKITRAIERALSDRPPVHCLFSASGGARMQEGAVSLMQMAKKISAALMRLDEAGIPYISVLTDPTTGGVTASFAHCWAISISRSRARSSKVRRAAELLNRPSGRSFRKAFNAASSGEARHAGCGDAACRNEGLDCHRAGPAAGRLHQHRCVGVVLTFSESIRFLFSLGPELKVVKWDLERMRVLLGALGNPHRQGRFVHVAGTNGKGSTCAMIEAALRASGLRTALYTSPHLNSPRERIVLGGQMISEAEWVSVFEEAHGAAERLLAGDAIETHPSFFEIVTAMAFLAFARAGVEMTVLETGLGGRLDATNVVEPELAVITPIDFDHEMFLGSSIESIAAEKAGILKAGRPAVFAAQRPEALAVLETRALELDIEVRHSSGWRVENLALERFGSRFTLAGDQRFRSNAPSLDCIRWKMRGRRLRRSR